MKRCMICGMQNTDANTVCIGCGNLLDEDHTKFVEGEAENPYSYSDTEYVHEQKDIKYEYNPYFNKNPRRNTFVAVFLSLFITALGHLYLKLYKRFLCFFVSYLVLYIIIVAISAVFDSTAILLGIYLLTIVWYIYGLYDVCMCVEAINLDNEVPKLIGIYDIY